ncbi:protease, serine, 8 (prostasin), isoform CRA_a [Mus musculus]|nr:protease, serine, 8 (prostasin), isoform CRA_a [Mus musculus]
MALRVGLGLGQLEAVTILLLLGLLQSGIPSCGAVIQPRITGGGSAKPGQWPWQRTQQGSV